MRENLRENHASCGGSVGGVKETDEEGPAWDPARWGSEITEGIAGVVTTILGYSKDGDDDCEDTGEGPKDGECLRKVS